MFFRSSENWKLTKKMQAYLPLPNEYDELGSNRVMAHLNHKFDSNLLQIRISKTTRDSVSVFFQHDFSSSVFSCMLYITVYHYCGWSYFSVFNVCLHFTRGSELVLIPVRMSIVLCHTTVAAAISLEGKRTTHDA